MQHINAILSLPSYNQVATICLFFQIFLLNSYCSKASPSQKKTTFGNCGNHITRSKIDRHKKRCSTGSLYYGKKPKSSTTSEVHLSFDIAIKHNSTESKIVHKCHACDEDFPSFYSLRLRRQKIHGTKKRTRNKSFWQKTNTRSWRRWQLSAKVGKSQTLPRRLWDG